MRFWCRRNITFSQDFSKARNWEKEAGVKTTRRKCSQTEMRKRETGEIKKKEKNQEEERTVEK